MLAIVIEQFGKGLDGIGRLRIRCEDELQSLNR
jgi:hypothetical protein